MKNMNMNVVLYETGTRQCVLAASNISLFRLISSPCSALKLGKKTTVKALAIWKITTLCDTNIGFTYCLSCSTAALLQEHDHEQHEEDDDHEQRDDDDHDGHDDHDCAWNV